MIKSSSGLRLVLLLVAVLVCVVACSASSVRAPASPSPKALRPSASATTTVSATPSPTTAAQERAAVLAATRAFFAAVDHSLKTGDAARVVATTTPGCKCRGIINFSQRIVREGRVVGGGVDVTNLRVTILEANVADVDLAYDYPAFRVTNSHGRVVDRGAREQGRAFVVLRPTTDQWLVDEVGDAR